MKKLVKNTIKNLGQALLRLIVLQTIDYILCLILGKENMILLDDFYYTYFNKSFVYMLALILEIIRMILGL